MPRATEHPSARVTSRRAADVPTSQSLTTWQLVLTAVCFALLTGLGEAAILLGVKVGLGLFIHLGPQVAWMSPVVQLLLFTPPTLVILIGRRLIPKAVTLRVVVGVFVFLSFASLMFVHQALHYVAIVLLGLGLAVVAGRHAAANRAQVFRLVFRVTPALVGVVLLLAGAVEGGRVFQERRELARQPAAMAGTPNILVIILDTVRALNLSLYGYARSTTPNLERLAQQGVVFERAIVTAPWTLPSHASMLTGRWPLELDGNDIQPLKLKVPTVTEVLRDNGFRTAGFVANSWYLNRESGLTGGFTHYEDFDRSLGMFLMSSALVRKITGKNWFRYFFRHYGEFERKEAPQINAEVLTWLTGDDRRPFFAFINYLEAHANYLPPPPFDTIFHLGVRGRRPPLGDTGYRRAKSEDAVDVEIAAYDGSIAYLDYEVGRLLEELSRRGILDNTLVIVTADHGEELT